MSKKNTIVKKEQSIIAKISKKISFIINTVMIMATTLGVKAYAAGGPPAFFTDALNVLKTVVILIGGGLAVWGVINLLEGYGNDNPGAKSQGMKQLMAGVGVALIGVLLVPQLSTLFTS